MTDQTPYQHYHYHQSVGGGTFGKIVALVWGAFLCWGFFILVVLYPWLLLIPLLVAYIGGAAIVLRAIAKNGQ